MNSYLRNSIAQNLINKRGGQNLKSQQGQGNGKQLQIQEVMDTINLYVKSANDLKQNFFNGFNLAKKRKSTSFQRNQQKVNQQSLIVTKIQLFISLCNLQLQKINKMLSNSTLVQLKSISVINYSKVLFYIKQKYSQLIKLVYRNLNLQNISQHQQLTQQDQKIVKQNRKRKLKQINDLEKQMSIVWEEGKNQKLALNAQSQSNTQSIANQSSFFVNFQGGNKQKSRNLEILAMDLNELNLRQLAKEQLQKQFLGIRIEAYNTYQKYTSHSHDEFNQSLNFLKQEQSVLMKQTRQESQKSKQLKSQFQRMKRELSEVKIINNLIRKRYLVRESIKMESEQAI